MMGRCSSHEWDCLLAYGLTEPHGEEREDIRVGHQTRELVAVIAAIVGSKQRFDADDFVLRFKPEPDPESDLERMWDSIESWMERVNGKVAKAG